MNNISNFERMWDILDKYTFEIDMQLYSHVACEICNKLLNNAYEGLCGCNYCYTCIKKYLENGNNHCPGHNDECQLKGICSLDNIVKSNSANRNVSKLSVKCPSEVCVHNCSLVDMHDHLRVCGEIDKDCPYAEIGCSTQPMKMEQMKNHLIAEVSHHHKLLIESMIHMRNEISSFMVDKQKEETSNEWTNLKNSIDLKISEALNKRSEEADRQMALVKHLHAELTNEKNRNLELQNEIQKTNDEREKEIVELEESFEVKLDQIRVELRNLEDRYPKSVSKLLPAKSKDEMEFLKKIKLLESNLENFSAAIWNRIEKYKNRGKLKEITEPEINPVPNLIIHTNDETTNIVKTVQRPSQPTINNIASFVWHIPDVSRVKKKSVVIDSGNFYSTNKQYKMWMDLYIVGHGGNIASNIRIRYYIGPGFHADVPIWPLNVTVTLTIKDKSNHEACQSISKPCSFEKPSMGWDLETFTFLYSSLTQAYVLEHNSITVECIVDL